MARPKPKPEDVKRTVSLRMTDAQRDQLTILAREEERSPTNYIVHLINQHLKEVRKKRPELQMDLLTK